MSLVKGVNICTIEEHLAVLYVIAMAPGRGVYLDELLEEGRQVAKDVLRTDTFPNGCVGWCETFGESNCDWKHNTTSDREIDAFGSEDVARVEDKVITLAKQAVTV